MAEQIEKFYANWFDCWVCVKPSLIDCKGPIFFQVQNRSKTLEQMIVRKIRTYEALIVRLQTVLPESLTRK